MNLGAFYPELNEVMHRGSWAGPGASGPTEAQCHIHERLGPLTPSAGDVWWELRAGSSPVAVATEVMAAFRDCGLPWLRSMTDLEVARDYTVRRGQAVEAAAFSILAGLHAEARTLIADFLASRPHATAVRAWAHRLGLLE